MFWSDKASAFFSLKQGSVTGDARHTHGEIGLAKFWGCFNSRVPGVLVEINGINDSTNYQAISADYLVAPTIRLRLGCEWTFQQGNDPTHNSKSTQKWLCATKGNAPQWPSQAPDLNPIENLQVELKLIMSWI